MESFVIRVPCHDFSNMSDKCEIGPWGLIDPTIILCQALGDDVIIYIPFCSADSYIAWVFKLLGGMYSGKRHDSSSVKHLHFTQWDPGGWSPVHWKSQHTWKLFIKTRTRGRVLQRWRRLMQEDFISNLVVFIISL
ncbi:hypothetical protein MtrunA17_Chr3g0077661 [Medicago truncatula]|uniref:Uncharacterized protein n=1 Tax=Medicago truncatula TaxID=3880 RepID=A0A396IHY8_MEDTR|nr:hypothetical protein MtrunA17_Chr3g0077661 [Medicago truncatula]